MNESVFIDEWRECLRAHYMHVIRNRDKVTEPSLTVVMKQAGFDDNALAELRVRATMHVDAVGADFVPDLAALDPYLSPPSNSGEGKGDARLFAGVDLSETSLADAVVVEAEEEANETPAEPADILDAAPPETTSTIEEPPDPDAPQQLSLF